jgi:ankyrin repeat protein
MQFEEDIRLALGQLPPTLEGVYAIIITQIHKGAPLSMRLAKKALRWLLCAQQALRSDEFLKALSADLDISNVTITVDNLLNICCNLVKYDSELDVVRFIHLSVREYLESREPEYEKSLSHSAVATACLQTCFHGSKPKRKAHLKNAQNKTFYDYAIVYWPVHCVQSSTYRRQGKLGKLFNGFIYDRKYRGWLNSWEESWVEMDLDTRGDSADNRLFQQLHECNSLWPNTIFLACAFGFMEVLQDGRCLEEKDWKKKNNQGHDPFNIAVRHGQRDVVEHLATSSGQESADEGSLKAAVSMSHKKMASYLLEQNPQLSITKGVIEVAVANADVETVEFLITKTDRVEVTTELINSAAENELSGKQIIDVLLNLGQDVSIVDRTIESACANRRHGFAIFESLLPRSGDSSITEEAVEIAASNDKCGLALLNALFHRASHLEVTTAMIKAACSNSTLEPLQFLLSRNEAAPISYSSLRQAVGNKEVGDQMLVLLLEKCKTILLDESLLLSAMGNRRLGVELTKLLLAKAGGITLTITKDVLEAAAENKRLGETLIQELLKDSKGWKLHPEVATAAARNHYSPVAVLTLLLKADEHLEITMDTIIAAAENPQYALELLDFILSHDPNIKITSAVVEAAAANEQSGFDVIQFLWRLGPFPITPAAFKAAAGNELCGDKILGIWLRNQLPDIPPAAVEAAMRNSSLGPEILRLLLRTGKIEISSKAIEYAAANNIYGPALIKAIIRHRSAIEVTDELLAVAVGNSVTGSEVLEILLTHVGSVRVTPVVVETAVASSWNLEAITTLLNAAEPASVTPEAVQYALRSYDKAITVVKCCLGKNPNVFLAPEVLDIIVERIDKADTLVEVFKLLETCGKDVQISEMMIKGAAQKSTMPVLLALAEHCDRRRETMPITQEVINASLRRGDSEAPARLEYLLKKLLDRGETIQVEENMVSIAVRTSWADKALKMLSELNGGAIPISPKVIDRAVVNPKLSNSIIEELLGIEPRRLKELRSNEAAIVTFIEEPNSARALKKWLLAFEQPVQVNENIMKAAAGVSGEIMTTILDILRIQGQESLIPSLISPEVVQAATTLETLNLLRGTMREYDQPMPITSGMMARSARRGIWQFKHLSRILRQQGQESMLPELVTEEVVLEAVKSSDAVRILTLLKDALGDERFCSFLSESHLMIAAGAMNDDCINFLYPLVSSEQPKQYYEDISALNSASWRIMSVHLRKLLERKVFPNANFAYGYSPLNAAIDYEELVTVHLMLKYPEVDPNSTDADGRTPLSIAASSGLTLFVKALLNRGVDRSIKDKDDKTAEDRAMEAGHYMIARLIRDFGTVVQPEEIAKEDEPPAAGMERLSLRKSMTL